jgi:hypothetical protein
MANNTSGQQIRIPNLPTGPITDANGMPTGDELTFRQALITLLQQFMGTEGLVMPSQDAANVTTIQNNTTTTPGATPSTTYTCQFGTLLYIPSTTTYPASPNDSVVVAMNDGTVNQAPVFKTITVS